MQNSRLSLPKKKISFVLFPLLAFVFVIFSPCLRNDFLNWDDTTHLLENPSIRVLDQEHVRNIFQTNVNKTYIPLTSLSFALEYNWFGYNAFVYHLDNVLLHLLVVALVFLLGLRLGLNLYGAGGAALLFGIHPMHVESVAWITERKDVLYSSFYLMAILFYLTYLKNQGRLFYFLTMGAMVLSILAKPMAVSLPLILLVFDWFLKRPWSKAVLIEKIPYFVLVGLVAWFTYREHARVPFHGWAESALIWIWTLVFYVRQFFFPGILLPIYQLPRPVSILNLEYSLAVFILILFLFVGWRLRKDRWLWLAGLFYFGSIFFLLRFDDAADINVVADRFMYLPSLGFCLWAGLFGENTWAWIKTRGRNLWSWIIVVGFVSIVLVFALRSFVQCGIWKNSLTLWSYQLLLSPQTPIALNNLANAIEDQPGFLSIQRDYKKYLELREQGIQIEKINVAQTTIRRIEYVFSLYKKAVELDSLYTDAFYNWAKLAQETGNSKEAVELYQKVLSLSPKYKDAYFNLGKLFQEDARADEAIAAYEKTIEADGENPDVYINVIKALTTAIQADQSNEQYTQARQSVLSRFRDLARLNKNSEVFYTNLGDVYQELRDYESARVSYQMALEVNPNYLSALNNLGNTFVQLGQLKEASFLFNKVIARNPKDMFAYVNLGGVYGRSRDFSKAIEFYQKAIQINPGYPETYFQLGFIYEQNGQMEKAMENYLQTVRLSPSYFEAYYNLGNVYAGLQMPAKAIESYQKTLEFNPNHLNALINLAILFFQEKQYDLALKYYDDARVLGWDVPKSFALELERHRRPR